MATKIFAFLVEGEVFMKFIMDTETNVKAPMWVAGMQSNPTVVDITDIPENVDYGWTYDGTTFTPPAE